MAQTSNTFRIFVSSTFSDLHAERNALQRFVFPRLRELCLQNGCRFQAIDLRWGVSAEAGRDQQTMKICLKEIERCQRVTPRPNFIVLLGDRYGWCPLPSEIPVAEFEQIIKNVSDDDKKILLRDENNRNGWYRLDKNAVPSVYCLQPWGDEFAEYSDWGKVERKLHGILENAAVDFDEKTRAKYVASATEQEIIQGLSGEKASEHVFCFFRNFSNRKELPADFGRRGNAKDFFELDENKQPNETANGKLENLKNRLRDNLPKQNVHEYQAKWLNEDSKKKTPLTTNHLGDLPKELINLPDDLEECRKVLNAEKPPKGENLCVDVFRQLARVMLEEIANIKSVSAVEKEKDEHQKFGAERAKHFRGRQNYLDKISEYIKTENQKPLVLWGASGSGKTALMARSAEEIHQSKLLVRFIGATPQSSDIRSLLESLCEQISAEYPAEETAIPADYNELIKEFPKRLAHATKDKPLVLILDALDQLSEADNAHNLRWLPENLPENVRLIVSTLRGESLKILERKFPENIIQLEPMPKAEGGKVLNKWLTDAKRTLQANQRAEVLTKFVVAKGLPLYLKFAFEEARLWHSYTELKPLATDVKGIIGDLFTRLSDEANHGAMMLSRSLGYLAAARYGLTEDELLEVLSMDKAVMKSFRDRSKNSPDVDSLPVVVWSRLYFDLEPYLTERASAGALLLSFYHRQLGEVTAQKYLSGDDKQHAHKHLADYFDGQNYWHETPEQYRNRVGEFPKSVRRANQRKASELAFQLRQSGDYERLEQIHTNLDFLESKTAAGLVFELAKDFTEALKIIPSERPQRRIIRLLEEALRRDIHFIARHREDYLQALFQCLWNSGWWYDCPQAANHYEEKDGPWSKDGEKLYKLLEKWREQKETETPGFRWIRSLRPPPLHLGTAQIAVLKGHDLGIDSVAISADSRQIVTGSWDKTVRIWDLETGKEIMVLKGHERSVTSVAINPDGRQIVSGSWDNTVRIWNLETGEELQVLKGHENSVNSVTISPDGQRIISCSEDKTVRIWDMKTGEELKVLTGHTFGEVSVAISSDGQRIVSADGNGLIRIWDIENGKVLNEVEMNSRVHCLDISPDGWMIIIGNFDGSIQILDMKTWRKLRTLKGHTYCVGSVAFNKDGRLIISGSRDNTIRVWDTKTGKELKVLEGFAVNSLALSADGKWIIFGSFNMVRIWAMETIQDTKFPKGHLSWIESITISADGQRIVSGDANGTIRIWDMETGEVLVVMKGHRDCVRDIAITLDGQRIVSGSDDLTIRIWDMKTGKKLRVIKLPTEVMPPQYGIDCVAVSIDGQRIVSGSGDKTIRIWDMKTGKELNVIKVLQLGEIWRVGISADGRQLVSHLIHSSGDTICIWDMETYEELEHFGVWEADFETIMNVKEFPLIANADNFETSVKDESRNVLAFFPESLSKIKNHPNVNAWIGGVDNYLSIIRLEGGSEFSG